MNKMNIVIFQNGISQGGAYADQKPAILPCRRKGREYDKGCGHASCHTAYAFKNCLCQNLSKTIEENSGPRRNDDQ